MKATLWFAAITLVMAAPTSFGMTELEALRAKCARQEQEIRLLQSQVGHQPAAAKTAPVAASTASASSTYVVKKGDSLERIARRNGCSARALCKANGLKSTAVIHPGQRLKLPGRPAPAAQLAAAPATTTKSPTVSQTARVSGSGTHKVSQGETFSSISRKHRIPLATLLAANPDVKPTQLRPGQTLRLSGSPAPSPAPAIRETAVASTKPAAPKPLATPRGMEPLSTSTPISTHSAPVSKVPSSPAPIPASHQVIVAETTTAAPTPPPAPAPAPAPAPQVEASPAPQPAPAQAAVETVESSPAPNTEKKIRSVTIEGEMTYGEFAAKHGTDPDRLNDLNGLDLTHATVLAKGSELYVPAQP